MAFFHAYSQTVADGTATSVVRPSDWNSGHNMTVTLAGNTAGASTLSGTNLIYQGGNNVVVSGVQGASVATVIFSGSNQSVQTQASGNIAGIGYTSTTQAGSTVGVTQNTAGLSAAWPPYITTYVAQTTQTQAAGSIAGIGTTTTTQAGSTIGATLNTNGLSLAYPPFLTTTAAQTNQTGNFYVTANSTQLSSTAGIDHRSLSFAGAGIASVGVSAGVVLISVPSGGGGGDGYNIIQASGNTTGTVNTYLSATMALAGGNNVTLSQSSNSISFIAPNSSSLAAGGNITFTTAGSTISIIGAGGATTINAYEPFANAPAVSTSFGQNSIYAEYIRPVQHVSMTAVEMMVSLSSATSSISHAVSQTISYGWYSKGTGTNSTRFESMATSSLAIIASYSSNLSGGYTVSNGANSTTFSSAGTVFGSVLSGQKILSLPMATSLNAGSDYWFVYANSTASVGNTGALRLSNYIMTMASGASGNSLGILATNGILASNTSVTNEQQMLAWSTTTNAWPTTIARSAMSNNGASINRMWIYMEV